ncbi:Hypothetical protein FKW44_017085, partial [Caligus rogercresseyi]
SQHRSRPDQLHNEKARKLDRSLVFKACSSFRARIQRVIDAEGGWIEKAEFTHLYEYFNV